MRPDGFTEPASAGHVRSIYQLGLLLEHGNGVKQSETAAVDLYQRAANAGFEPASKRLALIQGRLGEPLAVALATGAKEGETDQPTHGWTVASLENDGDSIEDTASGNMIAVPRPKPGTSAPTLPLSLRGSLPITAAYLDMPPSWIEETPTETLSGLDCFSKQGAIGPVWVPCPSLAGVASSDIQIH